MYKTKLISVDFEENTIELEVQHEFTVKAGEYIVLSKDEYEKLTSKNEQN